MHTIKASEFKAKCLHLMDQVNLTGKAITITKYGRPVAVLKPYRTSAKTIFGLHKGIVKSNDDLIEPLADPWDAEKC